MVVQRGRDDQGGHQLSSAADLRAEEDGSGTWLSTQDDSTYATELKLKSTSDLRHRHTAGNLEQNGTEPWSSCPTSSTAHTTAFRSQL